MENYYNEKQFVSDLSGLIEIKSVKGNCGDVTEKYPLGEGTPHNRGAYERYCTGKTRL